jgi:hypothetical protein
VVTLERIHHAASAAVWPAHDTGRARLSGAVQASIMAMVRAFVPPQNTP